MPENGMLLVTADKLSIAVHRGEVVAVFDLSSSQVFPRELGVRLLPAEARGFAQQLEEWADKAESIQ
jgi:hypothetical protein